jgi:hypothetical protein
MHLDQSHVDQFHRDGFLIAPGIFRPEEVSAMLEAVEGGNRVATTTFATQDAAWRGRARSMR